MYVMVIGGGKVGYFLTKRLLEEGHEVLLMEKNKSKYETIADELGDVVFYGDGCEMRTMEEAGMGRADVVVAVTGHDEDNLVIAQMAKRKFKVPKVIARVNNPKNEDIFHQLGIKTTVNSTNIIYNLLEQEVDVGEMIPLLALKGGDVEIVEAELTESSPVVEKELRDIELPQDCVIISIIRGEHLIFPRGETRFQVGDTVVALTNTGKERHLHDILVGQSMLRGKAP